MKTMIGNFRTFIGGAVLLACVVAPKLNAELVGYWPLDGDLMDQSGQGNNGEIISEFDPEFEDDVAPNLTGQSMFFDGETAVALGNPDILNFGTDDFTISAWVLKEAGSPRGNVYSNGGDNGGGIRSVLAIGESGGDQSVVLTLDDNESKIQARSQEPNDTLGLGLEPVTAEDNEWNHIAGMRRGNEALVFVNGVLADLVTTPDGYDLSGQSQLPVYLGVGASAASEPIGDFEKWFTGSIDEVAVWNEALSDDDIASLAGGGSVFEVGGGGGGCEALNSLGGDLDGNGTVEFADFLVLSGNFGNAVDSYESGDIDCNGTVEFADFLVLSGNFGQSLAGETAAVPEPSCGWLLAMGILGVMTRRQRGAARR